LHKKINSWLQGLDTKTQWQHVDMTMVH